MWVRDHLDGLWSDEDFLAWYPRDGRPGLSPAQLATVCVLQFVLNLSDRQAAEAVRCRIDFKYALGMELDDPGFHHSVLSDFRDRLAEGDRADHLLDLALERMRAAGLLKRRGRQRTDSTHVRAAVRDLTRLELITEAIRAALEELARDAPYLLDGVVDEEWAKRYGRPVRLVCQPSRPATRLKQAGVDAHTLLQRVGAQVTARFVPVAGRSRCCAGSSCRTSSSSTARAMPTPTCVRAPRLTDSRPAGWRSSLPTMPRPDGPAGVTSGGPAT
jgi:transposase